MKFAKYHGLGNDFVIADFRDHPGQLEDRNWIVQVCDRNFGVGADGILALLPPSTPNASLTMRVLNADGGEAEMCGNGIRCVAKHMYEKMNLPKQASYTIDTGAGPLHCGLTIENEEVQQVQVNMGPAKTTRTEIPMQGEEENCLGVPYSIQDLKGDNFSGALYAVSMGNPHAIFFVPPQNLRELAEKVGPVIETASLFPNRTNVEFAIVHGPNHIELVVWERGCGITLACGTGACATAVAACLAGHSPFDSPIRVELLGGSLQIQVPSSLEAILMTGPAQHVFDGTLP